MIIRSEIVRVRKNNKYFRTSVVSLVQTKINKGGLWVTLGNQGSVLGLLKWKLSCFFAIFKTHFLCAFRFLTECDSYTFLAEYCFLLLGTLKLVQCQTIEPLERGLE